MGFVITEEMRTRVYDCVKAHRFEHSVGGKDIADAVLAEVASMSSGGVGKDAKQTNALLAVLKERDSQDEKWGEDSHNNPEVWLAILMEEVGELAKSILHARFGGDRARFRGKEVIQVAAVALAMIEDGI